jgi:hypothetical protein
MYSKKKKTGTTCYFKDYFALLGIDRSMSELPDLGIDTI